MPSTKAPPHLLSPTIEESPSPRVEAPKLSCGHQKANNNVGADLTQKAYPISPDIHPNRVREDSSEGEITVIEATLSPSIKVHPPISISNSPTAQTALRNKDEAGAPNLRSLHQVNTSEGEAGMSELNLNDVVVNGEGQSRTGISRMTVPGQNSLSKPLLLHDSPRGDRPGNGCLLRSITDPRLDEKGRSTPTRFLGLGYTPFGVRTNADYEDELLTSPADQWRSLIASSRASTESLAKSAKERRLKRSVGNISSRSSRESSDLAAPRPMTPKRGEPKGQSKVAWPEREILREETPHSIHPTLQARVERFSPEKYSGNTPHHRGSSRRSASKPVPGAIKAMAALFDNASKESPDKPASILSGRTRDSLRESSSFPYRDAIDRSPTKSHPPRGTVSPMKSAVRLDDDPYQRKPAGTPILDRYSSTPDGPSTARASPSCFTIEDTPTRPLRDTLRPVKRFSPSGKEVAQPSPSKPTREIDHRSQPPRLGAMVPYQEEPPVGHFVRPSSSTSTTTQSRNASAAADPPPPPLDDDDARRHTTGTSSFLHAQIRSLQRQLDRRNEEILHLRRRLETQEHMDIGTLCEQLRVAKRECMTWRKRAEAAERRVAVFQRFGSRFQALTDGGVDGNDDESPATTTRKRVDDLGGGGYPSCPVRTESRDAFNNNRLRCAGNMGKMRLGGGGGDGVVFEDGIDHEVDARSEYELRSRRGGGSRRTVEIWEAAAQELMDFQHDGR
ncbi:hypothetical protein F4782DRAFT_91694 [Xylaria castorea]|nr:hypothetical protein F4782DRAFT_91694 [Xylaria castorea]